MKTVVGVGTDVLTGGTKRRTGSSSRLQRGLTDVISGGWTDGAKSACMRGRSLQTASRKLELEAELESKQMSRTAIVVEFGNLC